MAADTSASTDFCTRLASRGHHHGRVVRIPEKKGTDIIPGQIKFNSTTYPAPYGDASITCNINDHVYVDGMPSDPNLTAPNDPRTVTVTTSVKYTYFYYT